MSMDLIPSPALPIDVKTGELLEPTSSFGSLAAYIAKIDEAEMILKEARQQVSQWIVDQMDKNGGLLTDYDDGFKVTTKPEMRTVCDADRLIETLDELISEGVLDSSVLRETVKIKPEPSLTAIKKLLKIKKGNVGGRIKECLSEVPQPRRVTVKAAKPK